MSDQLSRSPRSVTVADHLWDTYALMSAEMGVDRDGLVNQALFAFARGHGYLTPGSTRASMPPPAARPFVEAPVAFTPAPAAAVSAAFQSLPSIPPVPAAAPAPAFVAPSAPEFTPSPLAAAASVPDDATPASSPSPTSPSSAVVPEPAFDPKATAAIRVRSTPTPAEPIAPAPAPAPAAQLFASAPPFASAQPIAPSAPQQVPTMSPDEVRAAQERVLQKAAELERLVRGEDSFPPSTHAEALPAELPVEHDEGTPVPAAAPEPTLVIYAEGREVDRVTSARFLIGRGKHCDLIINSGKVSREHAAIMREGDAFFIEDLGSSNGTWFDKKRITRRRVEDGDEYFVCSEKLSCRVTY